MSPRYIDTSSIVTMLSLSERQKAWARIIQFVFTDTLLFALNDQNTGTYFPTQEHTGKRQTKQT